MATEAHGNTRKNFNKIKTPKGWNPAVQRYHDHETGQACIIRNIFVLCFRVFPCASVAIEFGSRLTFYLLLLTLKTLMPKLLFARPETAGKLDPRTNKNEGPTP